MLRSILERVAFLAPTVLPKAIRGRQDSKSGHQEHRDDRKKQHQDIELARLGSLYSYRGGRTVRARCRWRGESTRPDSADAPGTSIIPFPFVFYTPETKIGFGGTVITMFRLSESAGTRQPSSISPIFVYTQKQQLIAMLGTELFFGAGRFRVNAGAGYSRFPNTIWGIGNNTPNALEEDYTPRVVSANLQFQRRVAARMVRRWQNRDRTPKTDRGLILPGHWRRASFRAPRTGGFSRLDYSLPGIRVTIPCIRGEADTVS